MTHWREFNKSKYLAASDLDGKDVAVKIEKVTGQEVEGENGRRDLCRVAQISVNGTPCKKVWIVNTTNAKVIAKLAKSNHIEDWGGVEVTLYATTTKLKGEVVDCIRIRLAGVK